MFFCNDTATTEIYTLSLHDASSDLVRRRRRPLRRLELGADATVDTALLGVVPQVALQGDRRPIDARSEEHTSELQSRQYLVCRLLLENKNNTYITTTCMSTYASTYS